MVLQVFEYILDEMEIEDQVSPLHIGWYEEPDQELNLQNPYAKITCLLLYF